MKGTRLIGLLIAITITDSCGERKVLTYGNEMAAVRWIATIHTAQTQYFSQFGKYAGSLAELGSPASGKAGPTAADLIPGDLARGKKSGYVFAVSRSSTGYTVTARPEVFHSTGRRSFYSDQTVVLRQQWGPEPANASSKEVQ